MFIGIDITIGSIGHSIIHLIILVTIGETHLDFIIIIQDGTVGECMDIVGITTDTIVGTTALGTIHLIM
tara:strand:- start:38 stop:244 length:207 start_codon:yes stop_codon:yes gene_type:complete